MTELARPKDLSSLDSCDVFEEFHRIEWIRILRYQWTERQGLLVSLVAVKTTNLI